MASFETYTAAGNYGLPTPYSQLHFVEYSGSHKAESIYSGSLSQALPFLLLPSLYALPSFQKQYEQQHSGTPSLHGCPSSLQQKARNLQPEAD